MKNGDIFSWKGFEWVALQVIRGDVVAIMREPWSTEPFDENNRNDWRTSTIRRKLKDELLPILGPENLATTRQTLEADNGDTSYGDCDDKVWLLSCNEYREYRETILKACRLEPGDIWWLTTPLYIDKNGSGCFVRYLESDGNMSTTYADISQRIVPVCRIHISALDPEKQGDLIQVRKELENIKASVKRIEEALEKYGEAGAELVE